MTVQSELSQAAEQPENGYQRRRRETRGALMEAGRALFIERPVEQVSIESITARAGVAKGSFYNHFPSRDALFEELIEQTVAGLLNKYETYEPHHVDPLASALARARFGFFTLLSDTDACNLLLQAGQPVQGGPVDRVMRMVLADRLSEGVALGSLSHLPLDIVYAALFGVVTETIAHLLTREEGFDAANAATTVTELCFAVLGLPHSSPQLGPLEPGQ
ncbi:MAG: TetR/AcrR family transcriptional regulator [Halioglobus sp.]|nr:TetR/AcrR family transcriptional regulator [Halioglobus sp.]